MDGIYLMVLGRNTSLSRAELRPFCDEVLYDAEKALMLAENLKFENPRDLPRAPEQLFLDRLGGLVRMGQVLGEYESKEALLKAIYNVIEFPEDGPIPKLGFSCFGGGKDFLSKIIYGVKDHYEKTGRKIRLENFRGKNMSSGQIFERRLLQKGYDFIVWQKGNTFLLARTVANQNLRNYELRDRGKDFRDAKMGMLPPKLAQILINLADPKPGATVVDPFCGSGTVNIEAAIMGYPTLGSDLNGTFVQRSAENFEQMSQKFRYDGSSGRFESGDASFIKFDELDNERTIIATEGFLGFNFERHPTREQVDENAQAVLELWERVFTNLAKTKVQRIALCLPAWNVGLSQRSIANRLFARVENLGFVPQPIFDDETRTFIYQREKTFVAREIALLVRQG